MATREDVLRTWRELLAKKQDVPLLRFALTGDGSSASTADVDGRPGWAWVRYDEEQGKVSQVRNKRFPGIPQDIPVIIGKKFVTDRNVQILGVNEPLYDMHLTESQLDSYLVPPHGPSHHAVYGTDPAEIDTRNLLPGRARPTDPATTTVYVETLLYDYGGVLTTFGGGGIDLAGYIPADTDRHRFVLITINPATNTLVATEGPVSVLPIAPDIPDAPSGHIPIALVMLEDSDTVVNNDMITDQRVLFTGAGSYVPFVNEQVAILEAEHDLQISRHVVEGV